VRERAIFLDQAYWVVTEYRARWQRLLTMNIEAEKPKLDAFAITEIVRSFFTGLCIERSLKSGKTSSNRKIDNFMTAPRSL